MITFDGSCLACEHPTGVERSFLLTLGAYAASSASLPCIVFRPQGSGIELPPGVESRTIPRMPLFLWRRTVLPRVLARLRPTVHLSPTTALPPSTACPCVGTVHELPELRAGAEEHALYGLRQDLAREALAERAWRVLVPSRHTGADLTRCHPELGDRIRVVPQPLDPAFHRVHPEVHSRVNRRGLVFIGAGRRRKNLPRLLAAYQSLPLGLRRAEPLTWIGSDGTAAATEGLELLPPLPTGELIRRLAAARGLVLPSLSEGFGLPALEALALGVPVLASRDSVPAELCGDAAVVVDPYDLGELAAGLVRLISDEDLACRARQLGPARARRFTADRSARGWIRVFAECSSSRAREAAG